MASLGQLPAPEDFSKLSDEEIKKLDNHKDILRKILELTNILEMTQKDYYERKELHQKLYKILQEYYPNCELHIFGSSINGYGCRGSDLDLLFLPFPGYCNTDFELCQEEFIPGPHRVLNGSYPKEKLLKMSSIDTLKFIRKVFEGRNQVFNKVFFIPARVPILNIKLTKFSFECDLSASNKLVVHNSELLRLFGKLDPRVRPLVMLLRYWAKTLGFIKKCLLSSYAFCFLVIFALQNTDPPVLPSLQFLRTLTETSCLVDGWETSFGTDLEKIPHGSNKESLKELLLHFFDFYWKFDFTQYVVSPLHGKPVLIKEIKRSKDKRIQAFPVSAFSIQDPFIEGRNISRNEFMKTSFKLALLIAKELVEYPDFSLSAFFDRKLYEDRIRSIFAPTLKLFVEDCIILPIFLSAAIIVKLGLKSPYTAWYDKVAYAVYNSLQYGLLMECEVIDKIWSKKLTTKAPKKKGRFSLVDTVRHMELVMSIQCAVYLNTWYNRKTVDKEISKADIKSADFDGCAALKREYAISRQLLPKDATFPEKPLLWFVCNCYKYPVGELPDMILIFSPLTSSFNIAGLDTFLKAFITKTVEKVVYQSG